MRPPVVAKSGETALRTAPPPDAAVQGIATREHRLVKMDIAKAVNAKHELNPKLISLRFANYPDHCPASNLWQYK
jgi:hypothetical protein